MSVPDLSGAGERLAVAAATGFGEFIRVSTQFRVDRWDEEQTIWTAQRAHRERDLPPGWEPSGQTFAYFGVDPYLTTAEDDCNMVVQAGWVALLGGVAGTTMTTKFSATQARIGAGTSATAAAYAQTALQGDTGGASTTSYYKLVSGAPSISTGSSPPTLIFTAAFGGAVANFAWNEFGTDNGAADSVTTTGGAASVFFNRGVSAQGTKGSGQTWTATETLSFGFPSGAGTVS
jgi:hypothetical protein